MKQQEAVVKGGAETWRVGLKVPLNVYEGDRPVCQCHQPEDAERIVAAMNARQEFEGRFSPAQFLEYEMSWPRVNRERGQLIDQSIRGPLSADDQKRLEALNAYVDYRLERRLQVTELYEREKLLSNQLHDRALKAEGEAAALREANAKLEQNWAANHAQYDAEIARLTESNTKLMGAAQASRESNAPLVEAAQNLLAAIVMRGSITGSRAYAELRAALAADADREGR